MRQLLLTFACLWVFLPLPALGANLVIPAEPSRVDIPDVKFYRVSYGFQEDDTGQFQLQVTLRYRKWASRIEHTKHLTFRLQFGEIVQRDEKTLILQLENRERVVGQHRWWYSPCWQPTHKVRIACDRSRSIRSVVIENCHLESRAAD
jgi:hypothetical protein